MVAGRQFQAYGMGLLVNNARQSQQGLRLSWNNLWKTGLELDGFVGGAFANMEVGDRWNKGVSDSYSSARLAYKRPNWAVSGNYLINGVGDEQGWSADAWARFWGGRELQAEFATQINDLFGNDYTHSDPTALMALVDVWKGKNWALKGYYSYADAAYNPWYSSVNPYFENYLNEDGTQWLPWERWLRNPLVMSNLDVIGGRLNFGWMKANWTAQYYGVHGRSSWWAHTMWGNADGTPVWGGGNSGATPYNGLMSLGVKKAIANGVDLNVTYARQMANDKAAFNALDDAQLAVVGLAVGF